MLKLRTMSIETTRINVSSGWSVVGHELAIRLLQETLTGIEQSLDGGVNTPATLHRGPRHAYLLTGARHVGKTTLATEYAKALLCSHTVDVDRPDVLLSRPCNACRSCRLIDSGNHPDLRFVRPCDKEGNVDRDAGILRVEQAGEIIHEAALSPLEGRFKCFIIQDMHFANMSFANKLLKTLEEPPTHVILLLTALDRSSLLPTIVSRCQLLELRPLSHELVALVLNERWQVERAKAELLARLANGRLGWAIKQIDDEQAWQWRSEQLETLRELVGSTRVERLAYVEKLAAKRNHGELVNILVLWTLWWRDIMLAQSGCLDSCINIDLKSEIEKLAHTIAPMVVQGYIRTLQQIEEYLRHTANLRLALDVLLLQLPTVRRI